MSTLRAWELCNPPKTFQSLLDFLFLFCHSDRHSRVNRPLGTKRMTPRWKLHVKRIRESRQQINNLLQIFKWPTKTLLVITIDIVVDLPIKYFNMISFLLHLSKKKRKIIVWIFFTISRKMIRFSHSIATWYSMFSHE